MENSANLVRTSCDDEPFLYRVISDRKNFFVMSLVFMCWIRSSPSIPASRELEHVQDGLKQHTIHHEHLVIPYTCENVLVLAVPVNVLGNGKFSGEERRVIPLR